MWKQAHPLDTCPRTIEELADYTNTDIRGPYGGSAKFVYTCDPAAMPVGVHGIWIRDVGEDEVLGTADDFTSDMTGDDRMIEPTYRRDQLWGRPPRRHPRSSSARAPASLVAIVTRRSAAHARVHRRVAATSRAGARHHARRDELPAVARRITPAARIALSELLPTRASIRGDTRCTSPAIRASASAPTSR